MNKNSSNLEIYGHTGKNIGNNIYKLDKPLRINRKKFVWDDEYANFSVLAINFSDNNAFCDVIYFTKDNDDALNNFRIKSGKGTEWSYVQNIVGVYNQHDVLLEVFEQ